MKMMELSVCRYCHEGDFAERLVSVCQCRGTLGTIHHTCLQAWIACSQTDHCEICRFTYQDQWELRPFSEWVSPDDVNGPQLPFSDVVTFMCVTLYCLLAIPYMLYAIVYTQPPFWLSVTMAVVSTLMATGYCVIVRVSFRPHYQSLWRWCRRNQTRRIVEQQIQDDNNDDSNGSNHRQSSIARPFELFNFHRQNSEANGSCTSSSIQDSGLLEQPPRVIRPPETKES